MNILRCADTVEAPYHMASGTEAFTEPPCTTKARVKVAWHRSSSSRSQAPGLKMSDRKGMVNTSRIGSIPTIAGSGGFHASMRSFLRPCPHLASRTRTASQQRPEAVDIGRTTPDLCLGLSPGLLRCLRRVRPLLRSIDLANKT